MFLFLSQTGNSNQIGRTLRNANANLFDPRQSAVSVRRTIPPDQADQTLSWGFVMRNTFISSLVADAKIQDGAAGKEDDRKPRRVALFREKTAASGVIRNILAALFGAAVGLLVIWATSA